FATASLSASHRVFPVLVFNPILPERSITSTISISGLNFKVYCLVSESLLLFSSVTKTVKVNDPGLVEVPSMEAVIELSTDSLGLPGSVTVMPSNEKELPDSVAPVGVELNDQVTFPAAFITPNPVPGGI